MVPMVLLKMAPNVSQLFVLICFIYVSARVSSTYRKRSLSALQYFLTFWLCILKHYIWDIHHISFNSVKVLSSTIGGYDVPYKGMWALTSPIPPSGSVTRSSDRADSSFPQTRSGYRKYCGHHTEHPLFPFTLSLFLSVQIIVTSLVWMVAHRLT